MSKQGKSKWIELSDLRKGAVFETIEGVRAVKTQYRYQNGGWECVLLSTGEYAHFAQDSPEDVQGSTHNSTMVREVSVLTGRG